MRFINTLELLFDGIVESEEELASLINNPVGILWQKYDKPLRHRLDHNYDHFLDILDNMMKTLEALSMKLGLDEWGNVCQSIHNLYSLLTSSV